jgi:hypothetical protein
MLETEGRLMGKRLGNFEANRDRGNAKRGAELFNFLWPDSRIRTACAQRLARSIRCAHKQAAASWSVTLFEWGVRLNVGQVLVLQYKSDDLLTRSSRDKSIYSAVRIPSHKFESALSKIAAISTKDWKDHELFIEAAAKKTVSPKEPSGILRHC